MKKIRKHLLVLLGTVAFIGIPGQAQNQSPDAVKTGEAMIDNGNAQIETEVSKGDDTNEETRPRQIEISAWYGVTFNDTENQNGIRRFDIKYEPNSKNLLFVFYDNALAFDNNFVANVERNAPIVGLGAKHDWSSKWFSKLEVGQRFLTTQDDQHLFNIENGYFFSSKFLAKVIGQYDIRQDDNLLTLGAFVDFEVQPWMRLEAGVFHADNLTFADTYNERFLVIPKFRWKKIELIVGGYYDRYQTQAESLNQFSGGYAHIIFPLVGELRGNAFFNYDKGFRNEITVVSIGLNQKL